MLSNKECVISVWQSKVRQRNAHARVYGVWRRLPETKILLQQHWHTLSVATHVWCKFNAHVWCTINGIHTQMSRLHCSRRMRFCYRLLIQQKHLETHYMSHQLQLRAVLHQNLYQYYVLHHRKFQQVDNSRTQTRTALSHQHYASVEKTRLYSPMLAILVVYSAEMLLAVC